MGPEDKFQKSLQDIAHETDGYCEYSECQECCQHDEFDHDICLDCGYERDPGESIDRAMDSLDTER